MARPHTFWSMEKGLCFVVSIGRLCFSAYSIATSRVRARSRTGEMQSMSGAIEVIATSKRTWSLPLPVHPWATVEAPNWRAALTRCLAITGREIAETSGYLPSYSALALSAGMQYSLANSSRASAT